jgi:arginine deiminase
VTRNLQFNRRDTLKMLGASASSLPWRRSWGSETIPRPVKPFIPSDVAPLKRVLMCPPNAGEYLLSRTDDDVLPIDDYEMDIVINEHGKLMEIIRASGAEVLKVPDLLETAIEKARSKGVWETWLNATHPTLAGDPKAVTAMTLLGADPATQYRTWADGSYRPVLDSVGAFIFSRDTAVTVPQGVMLLNVHSRHRVREEVLLRFVFDFAPELARYPVIFDAKQEGLLAEGGDFQVVDERTLFVGVGNRTDPRIAPILARRLDMDVLTIQTRKADWLRPPDKRERLRGVFLHLDTYFTHVGEKQALTLPWFLESAYVGKDPYTQFLKGIAPAGSISQDDVDAGLEYAKEIGKVRLFRAGSGDEDDSVKGMKLVDYVRGRGYQVTFVGGDVPQTDTLRHFFTDVMHEHGRQGANVVATSPDKIVAYEGATHTHAALRKAGVDVKTFPARELWPWNGGPHCLTMPLERG